MLICPPFVATNLTSGKRRASSPTWRPSDSQGYPAATITGTSWRRATSTTGSTNGALTRNVSSHGCRKSPRNPSSVSARSSSVHASWPRFGSTRASPVSRSGCARRSLGDGARSPARGGNRAASPAPRSLDPPRPRPSQPGDRQATRTEPKIDSPRYVRESTIIGRRRGSGRAFSPRTRRSASGSRPASRTFSTSIRGEQTGPSLP